jgi:hypothetical protein
MKLFNKTKASVEGSTLPRISKMETQELVTWFNTQIMYLGSSFDSWRYHNEPEVYVSESLEALNEIWKEIVARKNG